ncbi:hypothetical protein GRI58_04715 [Porphyrobacter algicida]|uniref:Uncharacterized protein n=1 Tax=Qipengyuania algicida TaxID=1836209 RepID=A0A845AFX8_9SPHN|nr:hypothetical protein [Qipengyuania algicida]MXP28123.1 hypothetical protein [Qipengyuania algicida]
MLFRIDFELGIYPDRVQVADRRSGRFVDFKSEIPFSAQGKLIADPRYLEYALVKAMRKVMSGGFILLDAKVKVLPTAPALRRSERDAVVDALRNIGFKAIRFESDHPSPIAA